MGEDGLESGSVFNLPEHVASANGHFDERLSRIGKLRIGCHLEVDAVVEASGIVPISFHP